MKYFIEEIRSWIFAIYIVLMLYLREYKYLILFRIHKINIHEFKRYSINAFYEYYHKANIYGLMDANEAINSYKEAYEMISRI